jgi:hypothetical protein
LPEEVKVSKTVIAVEKRVRKLERQIKAIHKSKNIDCNSNESYHEADSHLSSSIRRKGERTSLNVSDRNSIKPGQNSQLHQAYTEPMARSSPSQPSSSIQLTTMGRTPSSHADYTYEIESDSLMSNKLHTHLSSTVESPSSSYNDRSPIIGMRICDDGKTVEEFEGQWPDAISKVDYLSGDDHCHITYSEKSNQSPTMPLPLHIPHVQRGTLGQNNSAKGKHIILAKEVKRQDDHDFASVAESSQDDKKAINGQSLKKIDHSEEYKTIQEHKIETKVQRVLCNSETSASQYGVGTSDMSDEQNRTKFPEKNKTRDEKLRELERRGKQQSGIVVGDAKKDDLYRRRKRQADNRRNSDGWDR